MPETALERYLKERELRQLEEEATRPPPGLGHVLGGGILGALLGGGVGYAIGGTKLRGLPIGELRGLSIGAGIGTGFGTLGGQALMAHQGNKIQQAQDILTRPEKELQRELKHRALSKFYTPKQYRAISGN